MTNEEERRMEVGAEHGAGIVQPTTVLQLQHEVVDILAEALLRLVLSGRLCPGIGRGRGRNRRVKEAKPGEIFEESASEKTSEESPNCLALSR